MLKEFMISNGFGIVMSVILITFLIYIIKEWRVTLVYIIILAILIPIMYYLILYNFDLNLMGVGI